MKKVASTEDIPAGEAIVVEVEGRRVAVFNLDGAFYALADACSHQGGPLSQGQVNNSTVTCPWHGARFDIRTGEVLSPPAPTSVTSYKVLVEDDEIKIVL